MPDNFLENGILRSYAASEVSEIFLYKSSISRQLDIAAREGHAPNFHMRMAIPNWRTWVDYELDEFVIATILPAILFNRVANWPR